MTTHSALYQNCECVVITICSGNRIHCGYSFPIFIMLEILRKVNNFENKEVKNNKTVILNLFIFES